MDLMDRYVWAVRIFLPKEQRDDIIRELSDDLRSQAADKEAELGRPLGDEEQVRLLRHYGHPLLIAARYRPQQHLVGPIVYPYYWLALKVALALTLLGHLISTLVVAIVGGGASPAELGVALETLIRHVLAILGWFTVLAAGLDRWLTRSRVLENWNPIDLSSGPPARLATREAARAWEQVRYGLEHAASPLRVASIPQFIVCVVVSAWWLLGLKFPFLIFGHAARIVDWAPVVDTLFPFLVAFQLLVLANQFVRLTRHHDTRFLRFMRVVWANAGWVFLLLVLIADHKWVVWTGTAEQWRQFQALVRIGGRQLSIVDVVNYSISFALAIAAIAYLADTLRGWRLGRRRAAEPVLENKPSR